MEGSFSNGNDTVPVDKFSDNLVKGRQNPRNPLPGTEYFKSTIIELEGEAIDVKIVDLTQDGLNAVLDNNEVDLTQDDDNQEVNYLPLISLTKSKRKLRTSKKENKKQKLAKEKSVNIVVSEMNKIYKPGECMKYMRIEIHPVLSEAWYMADVAREVQTAGARVVTTAALCDACVLVWKRVMPHTLAPSDGQVKLSPTYESCERALYIACAADVSEHVGEHTLAEHIALKRDMVGCTLTLVIFGVKEYFKKSGRKTTNSSCKLMTEIDLEMAITDLLVSAGCDTVIVNTPNELALLIVQFTKAIAEAPYKREKRAIDEQADFYMRGDNKKSVALDKDGNGVGRLWQQMIAVLPMSSLETSRALCAQYRSPLALYEALQATDSQSELAEIGVTRAAVPGAKSRRLGPEFARKLYTLFTADDGNILV